MGLKEFMRNHPTLEGMKTDIALQESTLELLVESCNFQSMEISATIPRMASQLGSHPSLALQEIRLCGAAINDLHNCSNVNILDKLE